jgi:hypothetical protein
MDDYGGHVVKDRILDNDRWSIRHEIIFQQDDDDKFYRAYYSVGATENQDEGPWEYETSEIECTEVHQVEKLVKKWVDV